MDLSYFDYFMTVWLSLRTDRKYRMGTYSRALDRVAAKLTRRVINYR